MWNVIPDSCTHPNIEFTGPNSFGNAQGINNGPEYVEKGHESQPAQSRVFNCLLKAICDDVVNGGDNSTETKANEHTYNDRYQTLNI